mmetsp:Transcript_656/g.2068  ORF Transcript_656/g.2068 Transcript_656/m.2068 type:complete len:333 (+) Transcript_656:1065-2063(+)
MVPFLLSEEELHLVPQRELDGVALGLSFAAHALLLLLLDDGHHALEGPEEVLLLVLDEDLVPQLLPPLVDHHPGSSEEPEVEALVVVLELVHGFQGAVQLDLCVVQPRQALTLQHLRLLPPDPALVRHEPGLAELVLQAGDLLCHQSDLVVGLFELLLQRRHELLRRRVAAGQHVLVDVARRAQDHDAVLHLVGRRADVVVGGVSQLRRPPHLGDHGEQVALQPLDGRPLGGVEHGPLRVVFVVIGVRLFVVHQILVPVPGVRVLLLDHVEGLAQSLERLLGGLLLPLRGRPLFLAGRHGRASLPPPAGMGVRTTSPGDGASLRGSPSCPLR